MEGMIENLNHRFNLKKVPPKTPRVGDVGWMVDCEIAELSKFANLGHYLPNIPSPWVLCVAYAHEKLFLEPEPGSDFNCEPGCWDCGEFFCICEPEEPDHECEDGCPGCRLEEPEEPEEEDHD